MSKTKLIEIPATLSRALCDLDPDEIYAAGLKAGRRLERGALKRILESEMTTTNSWVDGSKAISLLSARAKRGKGRMT